MTTGEPVRTDVAELLRRADADPEAGDALFAMLYQELRRIAERNLRRGVAVTLGATTLVHEAWLGMAGREGLAFPDRARFLAYASRAMRGLVVDQARRRSARKRGRDHDVTLADDLLPATEPPEDLVRLADALADLEALQPPLAELVDLHFFCGFSLGEIASLRGVSERTVQRDWRKARLLLRRAME